MESTIVVERCNFGMIIMGFQHGTWLAFGDICSPPYEIRTTNTFHEYVSKWIIINIELMIGEKMIIFRSHKIANIENSFATVAIYFMRMETI